MRFFTRFLAFLTLLSILFTPLAACSTPPTLNPTATISPVAYLTPYLSPTPSRTLPAPTPLTTLPVTPPPTPTPYLYVLTNDDTLLGLAIRFGVTVADIEAANPGIDAHFLTVGKAIVIPVKQAEPTAQPSPTLIPLRWATPQCYPAGDGGSWCAFLIKNAQDRAVENVSVWIGLFSPEGENLASQVISPPLNLLDAGQELPLLAYFSQPYNPGNTSRAELMNVIYVEKKARRYLPASVQVGSVRIDPTRKQAEVAGQVVLTGTAKASALWVVTFAFDDHGAVAGMRKWEAESDPACLAPLPGGTPVSTGTASPTATPAPTRTIPKKCLSFDLTVFSLGPAINSVEVQVEARP